MWHLKIPKIAHFYWGGGKLSYLRYLTIESFHYYNPDWEIILYKPIVTQKSFFWKSGEQSYGDNYTDCYDRIKELGIIIKEVDFTTMGFFNDASAVHKSDYLRWHLLSTVGGVWADMDILFIKPMDEILFNKPYLSDINTVVCVHGSTGHSIGFLMGGEGNEYFKTLQQASMGAYIKEEYQSIGSLLCKKLFPTFESVVSKNSIPYNLPMEIVYAHNSVKVKELFQGGLDSTLPGSAVGIHWYGGSELAGRYLNSTNGGLYSDGNSLIDYYIRQTKALKETNKATKELKISVVMAFYNRQELLDKTLESLGKSAIKDYELIIVDDASATPLVCDCAKIIRVEKKDKWYNCSCVAWNKGLREATGDIIILNSPECYHTGDILSYVRDNIRPNLYLSFGCYSISKTETDDFHKGIFPTLIDAVVNGRTGWYNHTKHRPVAYHFCSAILKKDLDMIGGFDERYAYGVAFDDDEFIRTIRYLGMEVQIINQPYVIHQYHTHFEFNAYQSWKEPHALNQAIYNTGYNAKVHRDYGRDSDFFDPDIFRTSNQPIVKKKDTSEVGEQGVRSQTLESFLRKVGGKRGG